MIQIDHSGWLPLPFPLGTCYHSVLHCRLSIQQAKPDSACRIICKYNKADWARANDMLSSYHLVEGVDINHAWDHFHSFFMNVIDQCMPKNLLSVKPRIHPGLIVSCVKCVWKNICCLESGKNLRTMIFTLSSNAFVTSYLTDLNMPNGSSLTVFLMMRRLVNASGATVSPVKVLLPSQTQLLIIHW